MFPEDVALPVGGPGAREYIVIEMHYDNPQLHSGIYIYTHYSTSTYNFGIWLAHYHLLLSHNRSCGCIWNGILLL